MIIASYILAPFVGGVIGYVTNDIATVCCSVRIRLNISWDGACLSPPASFPKRKDG